MKQEIALTYKLSVYFRVLLLTYLSYHLKDVGSNVGVQVRKLFEKDIFPKATIAEWFDKYFGSNFDQRKATGYSLPTRVARLGCFLRSG